MSFSDFHVHSDFSDGKDNPETLAQRAISMGMPRLGISDHGWAEYDTECCVPRERLGEHVETLRALAERYRGRLDLRCGIEQDALSDASTAAYDYVIGSVHYLAPDPAASVDNTPEMLSALAEERFGGDVYALAEAYFKLVGEVCERTRCDVIGHFDLISKFNERFPIFDTAHPRYIAAWKAAADRLLPCGKPFEINTGAMSRRWRTFPYPSEDIQNYLRDHGARFLLSSDAHSAENLCYGFAEQERSALARGLKLTTL